MTAFFTFLAIIAGLIAGFFFGKTVARPIEAPGDGRQPPFQFFMSDLLWLFLLMHPAMVFFGLACRSGGVEWLPAGYLLLLCCAIWLGGIRTLSRLGIADVRRRALFLLFVLPVIVLGSFGVMIAAPVTVATVCQSIEYHEPMSMTPFWCGCGLILVLPPVGLAARRVAVWVAKGATMTEEP